MSNSELTKPSSWFHRARLLAVAAAPAMVLVAACGGTPSPSSQLSQDQQILAGCDPTAPPATFVEIDGTGSSAADAILTERMTAIESIVRRTAICSGQLRVIVFSSSSAATATLFDGSLHLDGATDNARLKRVPQAVTDAMSKIRAGYGPAVTGLDQNGSDITAQYRGAAEYIQQLGKPYRLNLYLLTDGFQNVRQDLQTKALRKADAVALADQVPVPKLPGASVVVAGLGKVAGTPPPSDMVEGLVAYYNELCKLSSAASCLSVSDLAAAGR